MRIVTLLCPRILDRRSTRQPDPTPLWPSAAPPLFPGTPPPPSPRPQRQISALGTAVEEGQRDVDALVDAFLTEEATEADQAEVGPSLPPPPAGSLNAASALNSAAHVLWSIRPMNPHRGFSSKGA